MTPSVSERLLALEALEAKWPGGLMPELTAIRAEIEAIAKEMREKCSGEGCHCRQIAADRLAKEGE